MELLTPEQLAEHLQVAPDTVRRMTAAGQIPHLRLGPRQVRYELSAVLEHLRVTPTSDDDAIAGFAAKMAERMAEKRAEGRSGWEDAELHDLQLNLMRALQDGCPIDVANYCMMIEDRGDQLSGALERFAGQVLWEARAEVEVIPTGERERLRQVYAQAVEVCSAWQSEDGALSKALGRLVEALNK